MTTGTCVANYATAYSMKFVGLEHLRKYLAPNKYIGKQMSPELLASAVKMLPILQPGIFEAVP